jgi:hypothetical protein
MKTFVSNIQYKIFAFGGTGSEIVKELKKLGFSSERILYFDADKRTLDHNGLPNRFLLGIDHAKGVGTKGDVDMGVRIFIDHREIFNRFADDDCLYLLIGALGGGTFSAMAPKMAEILEQKKRRFIVVSKMPVGESRKEKGNAFTALEAINLFTDKVLLFHGVLVEKYLQESGKEDAYAQINERLAGIIQFLLGKPVIRVITSAKRSEIKLEDNIERVKAYVDGHNWFVAHVDSKIFLGRTNRVLLDTIHNCPDAVSIVSPRKFEELTAFIYQESGFETELTKETRDGGVDIKVKTLPALRGTPFLTVVQAKHRLKGKIHSYEIQQLEGARRGASAQRGALVSTAEYTRDSIKYAIGQKIDLISFFDLVDDLQKLIKA